MKTYAFKETATSGDWLLPYELSTEELLFGVWNPADDVVTLGMSPDHIVWDDYGVRSRTFPAGSLSSYPFLTANSGDSSGIVTLIDPNLIDIVVPWTWLAQMGPGTVNVGIRYDRASDGARRTLLVGRLPIVDGAV